MNSNESHFSYHHAHHEQQQQYLPPLVIPPTSSTPRAGFQQYLHRNHHQQHQHSPTSPGKTHYVDPLSPDTPFSLCTPRSNYYFGHQQQGFDASINFSPSHSYNPHTPHDIRATNYSLSSFPPIHDDKEKVPEQPIDPAFGSSMPRNIALQYHQQLVHEPTFNIPSFVDHTAQYPHSQLQPHQSFQSIQPPFASSGPAADEADLTEYFGPIWQTPWPSLAHTSEPNVSIYEGEQLQYRSVGPNVHTSSSQTVPMDVEVGLAGGWMPSQEPLTSYGVPPPQRTTLSRSAHATGSTPSVLAPAFNFVPPPTGSDFATGPPAPSSSRPLPPPLPLTPRHDSFVKQPRASRRGSPPYVKKKGDSRGRPRSPKIKTKGRAKSFNPFNRKTVFLNLIKGKSSASPKVVPYSVTADATSGVITLSQRPLFLTPYNAAVPAGDTTFTPPDVSAGASMPSQNFSIEFPEGHYLDPCFAGSYQLQETLGSGGFGFVMTALHLASGLEVAVKFISRARIPPEHLVEDPVLGSQVPIEALILRLTDHKGIVKFLDFYQDPTYFYLVQELHGTPWHKPATELGKTVPRTPSLPDSDLCVSPTPMDPSMMAAMLSFKFGSSSRAPSPSRLSSPIVPRNVPLPTGPITPAPSPPNPAQRLHSDSYFSTSAPRSPASSIRSTLTPPKSSSLTVSRPSLGLPSAAHFPGATPAGFPSNATFVSHPFSLPQFALPANLGNGSSRQSPAAQLDQGFRFSPGRPVSSSMPPPPPPIPRPNMARRASHDLFECIEQHRMLDERRARYVFKQVVDTVGYLESMGISHRDIKDENLVVDSNFNVKLIDFGSAVVRDLNAPQPYYDKFFGTISFASSEILRNQAYRAPPAEIWTLGVLLSFLVTGESPFPDKQHAIDGNPTFVRPDGSWPRLSPECVDLIRGCLIADPNRRFTIERVQKHPWFGIP